MSILEKSYLVKFCSNLDGSQSLTPQRYQKILLGCLLGYKTVLFFICTSVKFHNCHHTTLHLNVYSNKFMRLSISFQACSRNIGKLNNTNIPFLSNHLTSYGRFFRILIKSFFDTVQYKNFRLHI